LEALDLARATLHLDANSTPLQVNLRLVVVPSHPS
jgi:hypothetical protein